MYFKKCSLQIEDAVVTLSLRHSTACPVICSIIPVHFVCSHLVTVAAAATVQWWLLDRAHLLCCSLNDGQTVSYHGIVFRLL